MEVDPGLFGGRCAAGTPGSIGGGNVPDGAGGALDAALPLPAGVVVSSTSSTSPLPSSPCSPGPGLFLLGPGVSADIPAPRLNCLILASMLAGSVGMLLGAASGIWSAGGAEGGADGGA